MTNKEAIKYLRQLYPNGGHCWLDEQRIEAIGMAVNALQEEHVNEDLDDAAYKFVMDNFGNPKEPLYKFDQRCFKAGAEWQKENLWKDAQGDDLPKIDREVIALLNNGKVVFAHRPYKGKYIGKNLTTGNIETFENKVYDKGGWNQPDVKYWLDCFFPNIEED